MKQSWLKLRNSNDYQSPTYVSEYVFDFSFGFPFSSQPNSSNREDANVLVSNKITGSFEPNWNRAGIVSESSRPQFSMNESIELISNWLCYDTS